MGPAYVAELCEAKLFRQSTTIVRDVGHALFWGEGGSCWADVYGEEVGTLAKTEGRKRVRRGERKTDRSRNSVGEVFSVFRKGTGAYGNGAVVTQYVWLKCERLN